MTHPLDVDGRSILCPECDGAKGYYVALGVPTDDQLWLMEVGMFHPARMVRRYWRPCQRCKDKEGRSTGVIVPPA